MLQFSTLPKDQKCETFIESASQTKTLWQRKAKLKPLTCSLRTWSLNFEYERKNLNQENKIVFKAPDKNYGNVDYTFR